MEKLIALGVDGIITNHPDSLIDLLKEKTAKKTQRQNNKV